MNTSSNHPTPSRPLPPCPYCKANGALFYKDDAHLLCSKCGKEMEFRVLSNGKIRITKQPGGVKKWLKTLLLIVLCLGVAGAVGYTVYDLVTDAPGQPAVPLATATPEPTAEPTPEPTPEPTEDAQAGFTLDDLFTRHPDVGVGKSEFKSIGDALPTPCIDFSDIPEVIEDSWEEIFASIDDGSYKDKYNIGDMKPLDLGQYGQVHMQIAAFDADNLSDGSGKAAITWISDELLAENHHMNPKRVMNDDGTYQKDTGAIGGWADSEMRAWLREEVWQAIPEEVRASIEQVQKSHNTFSEAGEEKGQTTSDRLWIPSYAEVFASDSPYAQLFPDAESRMKNRCDDPANDTWWWVRSALSSRAYTNVTASGGEDNYFTYVTGGVALGFCTGRVEKEQAHVQDGVIQDSWEEIFANIDNGSYREIYSVGDMKLLDLGQYGQVHMQIAAFDADNLSDGTGKAPITWISKELLAEERRMNPELVKNADGTYQNQMSTGAFGGWAKSELRTWLNGEVWDAIPDEVREGIVQVSKSCNGFSVKGSWIPIIFEDSLWIPSYEEVFSADGLYAQLFPDRESRVKYMIGASSASWWWLRSAYGLNGFNYVCSDGSNYYASAYYSGGLALGFCTGRVAKEQAHVQDGVIQDSWEEIFANIDNGSYREIYSVGDMKPLDLGQYGQVHMQIAAFDADVLSDGTGKAPITWISKELLAEEHRMNPGLVELDDGTYQLGTGAIGGWADSELRAWLNDSVMPAIPAEVQARIVSVQKQQSAVAEREYRVDQSTDDRLWIPSLAEVISEDSPYAQMFPDKESLVKYVVGSSSASSWWLRSANYANFFSNVSTSGHIGNFVSASYSYGVALGFCT